MLPELNNPYQGHVDARALLSTALFLRNNCGPNIRNFLKEPNFLKIRDLVIDLHKDFNRKVTEDPYTKHLFYTAYLCYQQSNNPVFIASALLHDTIELKRKNGQKIVKKDLFNLLKQNGIKQSEAEKITRIVSFLTPPEGDNSKYSSKDWIERKRKNFNKIMDYTPSRRMTSELLEMAQQIKIADETANLRETIVDVKSGKDGPDKEIHGHKSFADRVAVFEERIGIIAEKFPKHKLLPQLQSDLFFLKGCLQST